MDLKINLKMKFMRVYENLIDMINKKNRLKYKIIIFFIIKLYYLLLLLISNIIIYYYH